MATVSERGLPVVHHVFVSVVFFLNRVKKWGALIQTVTVLFLLLLSAPVLTLVQVARQMLTWFLVVIIHLYPTSAVPSVVEEGSLKRKFIFRTTHTGCVWYRHEAWVAYK